MLDRASVMSDKASPGLDGFPAILDDLPTALDCVPTMLDTPNPRSSAKNMANIGRPPRADAFLGGEDAINRFRRRGDADEMDEVGGHKFCANDFGHRLNTDEKRRRRGIFVERQSTK
jgi:hypothetical protein